MTTLSENELELFEELFGLKNGSVLDLNRKELIKFIYKSIDIDIDENYLSKVKTKQYNSTSMPQILRYILKYENKNKVIKLLTDLINYMETDYKRDIDYELLIKSKRIINNKTNGNLLIKTEDVEEELFDLIENINQSIEIGKPEFTLDRLHTLTIRYMKIICKNHNIEVDDNPKLNKLLKDYVKEINDELESELSATILKYTGAIFSEFNHVRNNKTYAHDNNILNENESLLIYNHLKNTLTFIKNLEKELNHFS